MNNIIWSDSVGAMEMYASLIEAIELAGGNIPWEGLEELTVKELCNTLRPNNIEFIHGSESIIVKCEEKNCRWNVYKKCSLVKVEISMYIDEHDIAPQCTDYDPIKGEIE